MSVSVYFLVQLRFSRKHVVANISVMKKIISFNVACCESFDLFVDVGLIYVVFFVVATHPPLSVSMVTQANRTVVLEVSRGPVAICLHRQRYGAHGNQSHDSHTHRLSNQSPICDNFYPK